MTSCAPNSRVVYLPTLRSLNCLWVFKELRYKYSTSEIWVSHIQLWRYQSLRTGSYVDHYIKVKVSLTSREDAEDGKECWPSVLTLTLGTTRTPQSCQLYTAVSRVWCSKTGTPVLTERLVPEGSWFKARAGRLRINIQDSNHTFGKEMILCG